LVPRSRELLLIPFDEIVEMEYSKRCIVDLAGMTGRSEKTVRDWIRSLTVDGYLEKTEGRISILEKGSSRLSCILEEMKELHFIPERHGIYSVVSLRTVYDSLKGWKDRVFICSLFLSGREFDLPEKIKELSSFRREITLRRLIASLDECNDGDEASFIDSFYRNSFHTLSSMEISEPDGWDADNINGMLVYAESRLRKGDIELSRMIYERILDQGRPNMFQWCMGKIGIINCLRKKGDLDEALKMIDRLQSGMGNRLSRAFLNQMKGDILSLMGREEESERLFDSSIRTFRYFGAVFFMIYTYNNWGILKFNRNRFEEASRLWERARRKANESKTEYALATILCNLSSIRRLKGQFDLAERYLERADRIFRKLGDLEGVSLVMYNRSLVLKDRGHRAEAERLFRSSFEIAAPLPSPQERAEREREFRKH